MATVSRQLPLEDLSAAKRRDVTEATYLKGLIKEAGRRRDALLARLTRLGRERPPAIPGSAEANGRAGVPEPSIDGCDTKELPPPIFFRPRGEVNLTTATGLVAAIQKAADRGRQVIVDLSEVTQIESAGFLILRRSLRREAQIITDVPEWAGCQLATKLKGACAAGRGISTRNEGSELAHVLKGLAVHLEQSAAAIRTRLDLVSLQTRLEGFQLTPRELDILNHLANGCTNAEIASKCWISENTVKFHVKNLLSKLQVTRRRHAMRIAKGESSST